MTENMTKGIRSTIGEPPEMGLQVSELWLYQYVHEVAGEGEWSLAIILCLYYVRIDIRLKWPKYITTFLAFFVSTKLLCLHMIGLLVLIYEVFY